MAIGSKLFKGTFFLGEPVKTNILLTVTSGGNRLDVYVNGLHVGYDDVGSQRVYAEPQFDPFPVMRVGAPNDVPMSALATWKLEIFDLSHWDTHFEQADVDEYIGRTSLANHFFYQYLQLNV